MSSAVMVGVVVAGGEADEELGDHATGGGVDLAGRLAGLGGQVGDERG